MANLLTVVAVVLTLVVAAGVVGRETQRLARTRIQRVFQFEEAVAWICDNVAYEVAAVLSPDDVRTILNWHLEYFRHKGVATNGTGEPSDEPVFVTSAETVEFVLQRATDSGADYTPEQIHAVLEAEMGYLDEIGALAEADGPDDPAAPGT